MSSTPKKVNTRKPKNVKEEVDQTLVQSNEENQDVLLSERLSFDELSILLEHYPDNERIILQTNKKRMYKPTNK
jgi:hypothetical protein